MPTPVYTPRINNNDDSVRISAVLAEIGAKVRAGDPIVEVETDKASFSVEATIDGYFLAVLGSCGDTIEVGTILAWLGAVPEEQIPVDALPGVPASTEGGDAASPTLKALLALRSYGLSAAEVPASGPRLTVADVERAARLRGAKQPLAGSSHVPVSEGWIPPATAGKILPFTPEQKGMLRTVTWHRDEAVAGYIELAWDPSPWDARAEEFRKANGLMTSPLLALMGRRLATIAGETPRINATLAPGGTYLYSQVHLGFTVQDKSNLYLVVIRDAAGKSEIDFVNELGMLQRAAMKHTLKADQISDATVAFSSMARWKVTRHVPVLPPRTALIVAHTATLNGAAVLGATYDHRLLTGFDVVQVLQKLSVPPELNSAP